MSSGSIPEPCEPRDVQLPERNRLGTDGPEFTILSGSFGGAWSNKRGDLTSPFYRGDDD